MREKDIERGREREREGDWVKKEKVSERGGERARASERGRAREGGWELNGCIKLPSLGPEPVHMMDHSPKAKHLILQRKINKLKKYKKGMEGREKGEVDV